METDQPLGRLIRTIKMECPECVSLVMQLRGRQVKEIVRGLEVDSEKEYHLCPACGVEVEILFRDNKKRVEHIDKTAYVKPVEDKRGGRSAYTKKSTRPESNVGEKGRGNFRKDSQRRS